MTRYRAPSTPRQLPENSRGFIRHGLYIFCSVFYALDEPAHKQDVNMRLSRLFNACMIGLLLMVVLFLVRIQLTMVRDSIHEQMAANLETASTSLGLVLQGAVLRALLQIVGGDKLIIPFC
ncbi:hypothetical protein [Raoultella ornithinolytica]|uniref:hypothetical protein n=1 Tax=Raoultella ornithinolytica TaxID=54291 RepID=UPI0013E4027B|nr:hypothetical protein [Raoultella ornithinolytica]